MRCHRLSAGSQRIAESRNWAKALRPQGALAKINTLVPSSPAGEAQASPSLFFPMFSISPSFAQLNTPVRTLLLLSAPGAEMDRAQRRKIEELRLGPNRARVARRACGTVLVRVCRCCVCGERIGQPATKRLSKSAGKRIGHLIQFDVAPTRAP